MNEEQRKMTPLATCEVADGIFAVNNDFVNFYLIKSNNGYVSVDAGANVGQSQQEIANLEISPAEVVATLLTHDHGDHTACLGIFDKVYGMNGKLATHVVKDGDVLNVDGLTVKVLATPGHKEDSVCFLINGKYLFVGDNMSLQGGKPALFNSVYNVSDEMQLRDIERLSKVYCTHIFTSHYGFVKK